MQPALTRGRTPGVATGFPPWPGGNRRLLEPIFGLISEQAPPSAWPSITFADPFLGGGVVSHAAKRFGFGRVVANDLALRSTLIGRALVANETVHLTERGVLRLFDPAPQLSNDSPLILERLAPSLREWARNAYWHLHGGTFTGTERAMVAVLLIRWLLRAFPMSLPAATDAPALADGDVDRVTGPRLQRYARQSRQLVTPTVLLRMAREMNAAALPGNATVTQADALRILPGTAADGVYLDRPYPGAQSYERAFALLHEFLGAEPMAPSPFSSRRPPIDALLDACARIPLLLLSANNAVWTADEWMAPRVARHRAAQRILSIPYRHYGAVASAGKNASNREILLLATRSTDRSRR